jgi:hypothetical protein
MARVALSPMASATGSATQWATLTSRASESPTATLPLSRRAAATSVPTVTRRARGTTVPTSGPSESPAKSPEESPTQARSESPGRLSAGPVCATVIASFAVVATLVVAVIWVRCYRTPM